MDSTLHEAAFKGSYDDVVRLLRDGVPINDVDSEGRVPLHKAIHGAAVHAAKNTLSWQCRGREPIIELLIRHGADVDAKDEAGYTPLYEAARGGRLDIVKLLLENGPAANPKTYDTQQTPRDKAKERGHDDVEQLLATYATE